MATSMSYRSAVGTYIELTKPRIIELLLVTTIPAMVVAADGWPGMWLIVVALVIENWQLIVQDGPRFAPAFIALNVSALAVGYFVAKLAGINRVQATTISIETGLQNATVSITVALTILNNNEMAIIPGLYALWMLASGFAFALWLSRTFAKEGMEKSAA